MKAVMFAVLWTVVSFSTFANAKNVEVCGSVFEEDGFKGIADTSTMTSYILVIDEVAEPRGRQKDLIQYQSNVYASLRTGSRVCAKGTLGISHDTRYPSFDLLNWVLTH